MPLCEECDDQPAETYCPADQALFCIDCDRHHGQSRLAARHTRVPLHQRERSPSRCWYHPKEEPQLFCSLCRIPACIHCKGVHLHGDGSYLRELGTTNTTPTTNPSTQCTRKVKEAVENAESQLKKLLDAKADLQESLKKTESRIFETLDVTLSQLSDHVQRKLEILLGHQAEARRQLSEARWSSNFLRYLHSVLSPPDFLAAWLRHNRIAALIDMRGNINSQNINIEELSTLVSSISYRIVNINFLVTMSYTRRTSAQCCRAIHGRFIIILNDPLALKFVERLVECCRSIYRMLSSDL